MPIMSVNAVGSILMGYLEPRVQKPPPVLKVNAKSGDVASAPPTT